MWNYEVKEPVYSLDNYMYAMDCQIGSTDQVPSTVTTYTNNYKCIFDTTTSYSSAFASTFTDYSSSNYNGDYSSTAEPTSQTTTFNTIGLEFTGLNYQDTWCLGKDDVHITVCLEQQRFLLINK